ncbi:CAP domain-containing protein [Pseudomonas shirazensis]
MKKVMYVMMFVVTSVTMNSCSADNAVKNEIENTITDETLVANYNYSNEELELMKLINDYRKSIGLNALERINHISYKSEEHNKYMIKNNKMSHDNFDSRSKNIMKLLRAKSIAENVAVSYPTPKAVLDGWLNSSGHKVNIEGDFTHFGLAITTDASGKKYYTNIFVKI